MFTKTLKRVLTLFFLALAIAGCSALEEPVNSLDDGISKMSTLSVGSTYQTKRVLSPSDPDYASLASQVDTSIGTNFQIVEVGEADVFKEGYTLGFNDSAIWLGSIIDASRLGESKFNEIIFDRKPYNFSISLKGTGQPVSGSVNGSLSSYNQKLSDLLSPVISNAQAGETEFSFESIYSEQDLAFKLGIGLGLDMNDIKAKLSVNFDFANKHIKSRVLVKYIQTYYTAAMDKPSRPSKMFADGLLFSEFQSKLSGNVCPVYISSIKYGRMGYLVINSTSDEDSTLAAVNTSVTYKGISGNVDMALVQSNVMNSSSIKAVMIGGSLTASSNVTGGLNGFLQWIQNAANESNVTAGIPVSFEMNYLKNNGVAEVYKMNKEYATIWIDEKTNTNVGTTTNTNTISVVNYIIRNEYDTDSIFSQITFGSITISYLDKFDNIIKSSSYSFTPGPLDIQTTRCVSNILEINLNDPENKIILSFNLSGSTSSVGNPCGTPWTQTGSIIVYAAELINNPSKYCNPFAYSGATFTITPK